MIFLILFLIAAPGIIVFIEFFSFLIKGSGVVHNILLSLAEIGSLIILPLAYGGFGKDNRCCGDETDTAAFSPAHQLTIIAIVLLSLAAYGYSRFRKSMAPPLMEVMVNTLIIIGMILNGVIYFHTTETFYSVFGTVPVICLGIMMLAKNQQLFASQFEHSEKSGKLSRIAWLILSSKPLLKFPLLLILCLPVLLILTFILLIFGQKPDSIVRAFTDTYKHGLSQWDFKCANIGCGGHYLCSVAANGHTTVVKPERIGFRNGGLIICNRQLLVSNAFEELVQERLPAVHRFIRKHYNKVGNVIHKHYHIFNIKLIADLIYFLMKPLEIFFLITLYALDKKPENRIAKQYLKTADRQSLEASLISKKLFSQTVSNFIS